MDWTRHQDHILHPKNIALIMGFSQTLKNFLHFNFYKPNYIVISMYNV